MITNFNAGQIWKGSNAQITVDLFPRCYNAGGEITDVRLAFYTTIGEESVVFSGETVTVSGRMATVVFQPVQLDTLDDGLLRYEVRLEKDGEPKVFNLETAYVIKTPNPYTPIDYMTVEEAETIIDEKVDDYFETSGATEIAEIVDEKMVDYWTSAQTESAITEATSGLSVPIATQNTLGVIKVGSGLTVDSAGTLTNKTLTFDLYNATNEERDAVRTFVYAHQSGYSYQFLYRIEDMEPNGYAIGTSFDFGSREEMYITFLWRKNAQEKVSLAYINSGGSIDIHNTRDIKEYSLPTASSDTLGGVKVGSGLTIDSGGTLETEIKHIDLNNTTQEEKVAINHYMVAHSADTLFEITIDNPDGDHGPLTTTYYGFGGDGTDIYMAFYCRGPQYYCYCLNTYGDFELNDSGRLVKSPNYSDYGPFNKHLHLSSGGTLYFDDTEVNSGGTYDDILNNWGAFIFVGAYGNLKDFTGPYDCPICPLYVDSSSTDSGRTLAFPKVIDEPTNGTIIHNSEVADHKITLDYGDYKISYYCGGSHNWIVGLTVTPNGGGGINIDDIPNNELWYRSDNGQIKNLYLDDWATHPAVVSNGYYTKKDLGKIVFATPLTELGAAACYAIGIKGVIIPDYITQLGVSCFAINPLTAITLPDTIANIPFDCFSQCRQLTEVHLGSGTTQLEETAFAYCESLSSLTIPASVTTFGDNLFFDCTALSDIYYQSTMSDWGNISKGTGWNSGCPTITVHCTDGNITI